MRMISKKIVLAVLALFAVIGSSTIEARGGGYHGGGRGGHWGGRGYRRGGWGWGWGVGTGLALGVGWGLSDPWYTRGYGYYDSVNACFGDLEQIRHAYKRAVNRIHQLEAQLGQSNDDQ